MKTLSRWSSPLNRVCSANVGHLISRVARAGNGPGDSSQATARAQALNRLIASAPISSPWPVKLGPGSPSRIRSAISCPAAGAV